MIASAPFTGWRTAARENERARRYLGDARACRTVNGLNRFHILLEQKLAPREFAELARVAAVAGAPEASRDWIERLKAFCPDAFEAPEHFGRRPFGDHLTLYSDPAIARAKKDLLVAFTGNARRLMLPAFVFLQAMSSCDWDVLVVRRRGGLLLDGLEGVAEDFDGVVAHLKRLLRPERYRSVATLGTSSGGRCAVLAAFRFGARRGVCISGGSPGPESDAAAGAADPRPELLFVHGDGFAPDRTAAAELARLWGGNIHAVADADKHNVLRTLLNRGDLRPFLKDMLS